MMDTQAITTKSLQQIINSDEFLSSELSKSNIVLVKDRIFFPDYIVVLSSQMMKVMDGVTLEGREIYRNKIIDALKSHGLVYSTVVYGYVLI